MWLPSPPQPPTPSSPPLPPPPSSSSPSPPSSSTTPSSAAAASYRQQCLLSCLQAAKSFFGALLSVGPEGLLHRPFPAFAEVFFVTIAASRLLLLRPESRASPPAATTTSTAPDNGGGGGTGPRGGWEWDLDAARQTLDLPVVLQRLVESLEEARALRDGRAAAAAASGGGSGNSSGGDRATVANDGGGVNGDKDDPFKLYIIKIRWVKGWLETRLADNRSAVATSTMGTESSAAAAAEEHRRDVVEPGGGGGLSSLGHQGAYDWFGLGLGLTRYG